MNTCTLLQVCLQACTSVQECCTQLSKEDIHRLDANIVLKQSSMPTTVQLGSAHYRAHVDNICTLLLLEEADELEDKGDFYLVMWAKKWKMVTVVGVSQ